METPRRIIVDCDPGQDDAVNLFLALSSPEQLELVGITTVAGNVPLALTSRNACMIRELAGVDSPVYAGCERPLRRPLITAEKVHGASGLDGLPIFKPRRGPERTNAVDFLVTTLSAAMAEPITLVLSGPVTNLATALRREPQIVRGIEQIVLMGGASREGGNYSPSAEFNMLVDPDAAAMVLSSGAQITMMGLDVTTQVRLTPQRIARMGKVPSKVAQVVARMLECHGQHDRPRYGGQGVPLHDPCTIAFLLMPTLFEAEYCNVAVETESELTRGHTAVDFWHVTDRRPNVNWVYKVDDVRFFELLYERFARFD